MNKIWQTPQPFFNILDREFSFTLDVAATIHNAKCRRFFSPVTDALTQKWAGEIFWMNPPYGRGVDVYSWVQKAYNSTCEIFPHTIGVCLLPASTDTKWFHKYCMKACEIRFVRDRLWFSLNGNEPKRSNHKSMVVVFTSNDDTGFKPKISSISNCKGS